MVSVGEGDDRLLLNEPRSIAFDSLAPDIALAAASCHLQGGSDIRRERCSLMASNVANSAAPKDSARTITVVVRRLPEGVWLATSDDLPGLIVETKTREEAIDLSPELALELLNESGERSDRARAP